MFFIKFGTFLNNFELPWGLICLAIFFRGGGRYSLDRLLGKEV